jgi:TusA-related sulfurtransferase
MADVQLDYQGLNCPMSIVRSSQKVKTMVDGKTLGVIAGAPAFNTDIRA